MRYFSIVSLGAALLVYGFAVCTPALAQGTTPGTTLNTSPESYDAQKAKLKPVRFDSMAELQGVARNYIGKSVEFRGQVKGIFTRGANLALMFQVVEGENIVVDADASFRDSPATKPGTLSRFLCRVDGVNGPDVALSLVDATNAPESGSLFKADDNDLVMAPTNGDSLPVPEAIMIGPDSSLSSVPSSNTVVMAPQVITPNQNRARAATSAPPRSSTARTRSAGNPYFGFSDSQRAAYKAMARRENPRLADDMADYIASSILSAAQTQNLDPRFLAAIVQVESSFDPYCLSSAGAMGLGQLMPFNLRPLGVGNAWDPMQNLNGTARLLRQNLNTYAGQPNGTLLAVAAYHAGVGAVNRAGKQVPPRAATQRYVWKVYYAYKALAPELFR